MLCPVDNVSIADVAYMFFYSQETNEKALHERGRGSAAQADCGGLGGGLRVGIDILQVVVLAVLGSVGVGFDPDY